MELSLYLENVDAATFMKTPTGEEYILIINQALLDMHRNQREALLQPHQAQEHGTRENILNNGEWGIHPQSVCDAVLSDT